MSKSLGNILTLPDIVKKGFHPLDLRYLLLSTHYRSHTVFTWKGLEDARAARRSIVKWFMNGGAGLAAPTLQQGLPLPQARAEDVRECRDRFVEAMHADLATPVAISA